jgi:hypothetical protein
MTYIFVIGVSIYLDPMIVDDNYTIISDASQGVYRFFIMQIIWFEMLKGFTNLSFFKGYIF